MALDPRGIGAHDLSAAGVCSGEKRRENTMKKRVSAAMGIIAAGMSSAASADQLVQMGNLSGGPGQSMQDIVLDQFDTQGGALVLNFVQLDFLTAVIGGGMSNGTGQPTDVFASLSVDYFLGSDLLAETEAVIDFQVSNNTSSSFTLFDNDTAQVSIMDPAMLAPWIGSGSIVLTAAIDFLTSESPPGSVDFNAGGSVQYTVTYDFSAIPAPGSLAVFGIGSLLFRRRRSGAM